MNRQMGIDMITTMMEVRENPRPGLINALLQLRIDGEPAPDLEILGNLGLIIGGGFDTTTALTAHSLEWLSENPDQRELLSRERDTLLNPATEEFLRFYTPAPGDGRTFSDDVEVEGTRFKEGERLWISWAMANRDPSVFEKPNELIMDRKGNRHFSFGIGVHRCVGSNVARTVFKSMLTAVLDRMPDYVCDPEGTEHYETIGVIQGMKHLPATFTPSKPLGPDWTRRWRNCSGSATSSSRPGPSPNTRTPSSSTDLEPRSPTRWFDEHRQTNLGGHDEAHQGPGCLGGRPDGGRDGWSRPLLRRFCNPGNFDLLTNRYDRASWYWFVARCNPDGI